MNQHASNHSRRRFIKLTVISLTAAPFANALLSGTATAVEMVSETDPQAVDLDYLAEATQSKKRTDPTAVCRNCKFYMATPDSASGTCAILLPSKHVAANGWCAAWTKQG
jgi:hypothetical protein